MNLSSLPSLALLFKHDGGLALAPDDPGSVIPAPHGRVRLTDRDMLVAENPNLHQFNANASALAGTPIFGHAVVLPVEP